MVAAEQEEYTRAVDGNADLAFVSSLDESLSWDNPELLLQGYGGVMFGGSGEFDFDGGRPDDDIARLTSQAIVARLKPFVEYLLRTDFPTLGICYGHQIIAESIGVPVVSDPAQKKTGTYDVVLTEAGKQDLLCKNLPERFAAQYGHKDSLSSLPQSAVLLASSDRCKTSMLRYGARVYTTQFHPELRAEDIAWKLQNSPGYVPEGVSVKSLIKPSIEASRIIPLFIQKIVN